MCRSCNGVSNIKERISNHDFIEQMRELYGLDSKPIKDRKHKNMRKSVLDRIEFQIRVLENKINKVGYSEVYQRLADLLSVPYSDSTIKEFNIIMEEYNEILKNEIITLLKES